MNNYRHTRTLSFTSGKGGVGKTTVVTNMAAQLSRQGHRVLLLDGDLGMANIDVMMGVRAGKNIYDVMSGKASLQEVLVEVMPNVFLIPGGSGIYELARISSLQKQAILSQIEQLEMNFDYMLIDTAPGIDDNVLYLNSAAQEINVILTPDPASLTDAYALIKVLNQRQREENFSIICNQVRSEEEGHALYKKLFDVSSRFLYVSLDYKGSIPIDSALSKANQTRQIVSVCNRRASASLAFSDLAQKYAGFKSIDEAKGGLQFFWQQLVGVA